MKTAGHFGEQVRVDVSSHTACLFRETILSYGNPMYHVSLARLFIPCLSLYASASASASRFSYSSCSNPINGLCNGRRIFIIINIPNHTIPTSLSCSLDRCFFVSFLWALLSPYASSHIYTSCFPFSWVLPTIEPTLPATGDFVSPPPQRFPCSPPRSCTPRSLFLFLYVLDETLGRGAQ
jgi:hypothetical protein